MATFKQNIPATLTGHVAPQSLTKTSSSIGTGGALLPAKARAFAIICSTGAVTAATAVYKIVSCDDADGTNPVDVAGYTAIATHTAANSITVAEIPALAIPAGKYFAVVVTTSGSTGTAICSATVLRLDPYYPA